MPPPCCASPGPARAGSALPGSVRTRTRLHRVPAHHPPLVRASDAMRFQATPLLTVLLVRPFALPLLRPPLTSRSGAAPSPFQARGEISPGKNAILHRTAVAFTSPGPDHKSFAVTCLLALPDAASDALRVPRLAVSIHASSPRSVALTQLRFSSLAVVSSRENLHLQDRAHAGRT